MKLFVKSFFKSFSWISLFCFILLSSTLYLASKPIINYVAFAHKHLVHNEYGRERVRGCFFVPQDPVEAILIGLIDSEHEAIFIASYQMTNGEVAEALIRARKRNVYIEMVVDSSALVSKYHKLALLQNAGVKIYVFEEKFALMHNKYFIFHRNIHDLKIIWTGSANTTRAGLNKNRENVHVTDSAYVWQKYQQGFEQLKRDIKVKPVNYQQLQTWWDALVNLLPVWLKSRQ